MMSSRPRPGPARIGVAVSDSAGLMAVPSQVIERTGDDAADRRRIAEHRRRGGGRAGRGGPAAVAGRLRRAGGARAPGPRRRRWPRSSACRWSCTTSGSDRHRRTSASGRRGRQGPRRRRVGRPGRGRVILQSWLDSAEAAGSPVDADRPARLRARSTSTATDVRRPAGVPVAVHRPGVLLMGCLPRRGGGRRRGWAPDRTLSPPGSGRRGDRHHRRAGHVDRRHRRAARARGRHHQGAGLPLLRPAQRRRPHRGRRLHLAQERGHVDGARRPRGRAPRSTPDPAHHPRGPDPRPGRRPGRPAAGAVGREVHGTWPASGTVRSQFQPAGSTSLEGLLLPETYFVEAEDDETEILRADGRSLRPASPPSSASPTRRPRLGVTPYQAMIVASLVERGGAGRRRTGQDRPRRSTTALGQDAAADRRHRALRHRPASARTRSCFTRPRDRLAVQHLQDRRPAARARSPARAGPSLEAALSAHAGAVALLRAGRRRRGCTPSPTTGAEFNRLRRAVHRQGALLTAARRWQLRGWPPGPDTRLAAVIGSPVRHSRSPAMHNAAFRALGLDWVYVAFEVAPGEVADALAGMRALGHRRACR